jgi:hypothetical protein
MEFTDTQRDLARRLHAELTAEGEWVGDRQDAIWSLFTPDEWAGLLEILRAVAGVPTPLRLGDRVAYVGAGYNRAPRPGTIVAIDEDAASAARAGGSPARVAVDDHADLPAPAPPDAPRAAPRL